jgi:hypothetical protein
VNRPVLAVERAARKDLRALPPDYRDSAIAKGYLLLARRLDAGVSARESAGLLREMRMTLLTLHELSPPAGEESFTDELQARREKWMVNLEKSGNG